MCYINVIKCNILKSLRILIVSNPNLDCVDVKSLIISLHYIYVILYIYYIYIYIYWNNEGQEEKKKREEKILYKESVYTITFYTTLFPRLDTYVINNS